MSAQFGRSNFDGQPVDEEYLTKVMAFLAPYGPDGCSCFYKHNVAMIFNAFHTTQESRKEKQPHTSRSGAIFTWDGRLDNRSDLIRELGQVVANDSTDVQIVAAAYDEWRDQCFAKLIGDWALAIWDSTVQSVMLAKDIIGTRHLYYLLDESQVSWCSVVDPLVLLAGKTFRVNEEYIAGWLSSFPAAQLTPYLGIQCVPPSCFVRVRHRSCEMQRYWDFDPRERIRYRSDGEYEEHFRSVFGEAVRRRLHSDSPVLAELSGGMDSSSIVCMADAIMARGDGETRRLDTVSYYDDSEPNWNERPYVATVENKRGRAGCHIDIGSFRSFALDCEVNHFAALISSIASPRQRDQKFAECLARHRNRVVLSGIGGDELTGGVPSPIPELSDLLARGKFMELAHKLKVWALDRRTPWFHLLAEVVSEFVPPSLVGLAQGAHSVFWLRRRFANHFRVAAALYRGRSKFLGPLPSFQQSMKTLDLLRGQLGCYALSADAPYERRYPYLDRDFIEFAIAVPRGQMVRPGQRRSLMRRALARIVPDEILQRKRKAFVIRGPLASISTDWQDLLTLCKDSRADSLGIIDSEKFLDALKRAGCGQATPLIPLLRTVALERWLRSLEGWSCVHSGIVPSSGSQRQIVTAQNSASALPADEGRSLN